LFDNHLLGIYHARILRTSELPFRAKTYILNDAMSRTFQTYKSSDEPVPGYRLVRFLGKGNFGEVWMASAPGNKKVALKIIDLRGREGLQESKAIERIKDINHAHLVSIFAFWVIDAEGRILDDQTIAQLALGKSEVVDAKPSATMFVDLDKARPVELIVAMSLGSKNLSDLLDEYREKQAVGIPTDVLLDHMEDAAKGIDYLNLPIHDLGKGPLSIIHGDIKPQNLLIVGNSVQICDFGLARSIDELRKTATAMGSYAYAAPELLTGHPHVRSDQYCLAVSYIELRTGDLPLGGETNILKIAEMHRDGNLNMSGLGPNEAEVIRKATSPDPHDRYATCREMVRDLRTAVENDIAGKPPRREPLDAANTRRGRGSQTTMGKREPVRRTNRLLITALLLLIVGGLSAAAYVWRDRLQDLFEKGNVPPVVAKEDQKKPDPSSSSPKPSTTPATSAKSAAPDNTAKPPIVEHPVKPVDSSHETKPALVKPPDVKPPDVKPVVKPPVKSPDKPPVKIATNPLFSNSALWQDRLKTGLYLAARTYVITHPPVAKKPPVEVTPKAPLAAPFIAEARTDFAAGQFAAARKALAAARESLKQVPDAGLSRQAAMWEQAVALADPQTSADERRAAADAVKADGKDVGDFYVSLYDFVTNDRKDSFPDASSWIADLLDNAISLKAGPPPAKAAEPFAPVTDPTLRRLYRDRAERKLLKGDSNVDRAVADAERAGASDMTTDALGRRATKQKSRELVLADIDAAIDGGKKAQNPYGLAALGAAYILRANYDNHPAYNRDARNTDLDTAAACLKQATVLSGGVPGPIGLLVPASTGSSSSARVPALADSSAQPAKAGTPTQYLYHLAAARAHEDMARLVERSPAFNISRAVSEYAKAAEVNPQSPRPQSSVGRCLYHGLADMYLPPNDLTWTDGSHFADAFAAADAGEKALRAALANDAGYSEAADNLARLDHFRAITHYDRYLDDGGSEELTKAKECSAKADDELKVAWELAQKQGVSGSEMCALQWALFPQSDVRLAIAPEDRRGAIRKRLSAVEHAPLPPGGESDRKRTLAMGRGRLAQLENKYDDAVTIYSDILPPNLADVRDEHAEALLARAEARLGTVAKRPPDNLNWGTKKIPIDATVSPQQLEAIKTAAAEAEAAGRVASTPKDRIRATELQFIAHTLLYFYVTNPAERSSMYAKGLDEITSLRANAPRRPHEYRWYAAWAHVAFAQMNRVPADRSALLKIYSSAVLWAGRSAEKCPRKSLRVEVQNSLLKPYLDAALKFADGYLNHTPPPNPPFRTELEKKRQEWREILAAVSDQK
jgi:serine/threonine protein kinase